MDLFNVFISILTLFIVGLSGYLAVKFDILNEGFIKTLPSFLLNITLPCMIMTSMQIPYSQDKIEGMVSIFIISLLYYTLTVGISYLVPKVLMIRSDDEKDIYMFITIFANVSFIGYPVLISIYSQEAIFYASIFNIPFNLLIFTLGVNIMNRKSGGNLKALLSPSLISVLLGIIFFYFTVELPEFILNPLEMIGNLTTPLSMIFIGGSLTKISFRNIFSEWRLYGISAIRLLLIPIITLMLLRNFVTDPLLLGIPVIISGMPAASNCAIIANEYGGNYELASKGVFITTFLSLVTIPILVTILSIFT